MPKSASAGSRIRQLREGRGLTRGRLAEQADVGVNTILRIEVHDHQPTLRILTKLARALGCTVADLLAPVEEQAS